MIHSVDDCSLFLAKKNFALGTLRDKMPENRRMKLDLLLVVVSFRSRL
jgi:hypothetical protein